MPTIIRFAPGVKELRIEEDEWEISIDDRVLRHAPTQTAFGIVFEGRPGDERKSSNHLAVLLPGPCVEPLQELGETAIALYLIAIGELGYTKPEWEPVPEPKAQAIQ